jgi:hypothetical protein
MTTLTQAKSVVLEMYENTEEKEFIVLSKKIEEHIKSVADGTDEKSIKISVRTTANRVKPDSVSVDMIDALFICIKEVGTKVRTGLTGYNNSLLKYREDVQAYDDEKKRYDDQLASWESDKGTRRGDRLSEWIIDHPEPVPPTTSQPIIPSDPDHLYTRMQNHKLQKIFNMLIPSAIAFNHLRERNRKLTIQQSQSAQDHHGNPAGDLDDRINATSGAGGQQAQTLRKELKRKMSQITVDERKRQKRREFDMDLLRGTVQTLVSLQIQLTNRQLFELALRDNGTIVQSKQLVRSHLAPGLARGASA